MDTNFSILLNKYIDDLALNKNDLIKKSKIDKSTFYKILNGTRVPTKRQFHTILDLLTISEDDILLLERTYFSVEHGQQSVDSIVGVRDCLTALSKKNGALFYVPLSGVGADYVKDRKYFPFSEFQNYFYEELDKKLSDENARMDIFMDSSYSEIFNLIIGLLIKHSGRKGFVRHLFQYPNNLSANQISILKSFAEEAAVITGNLRFYEVWYYYSLGNAASSEGTFLPYEIIFEDELILFSTEGFLIIDDQETIKAAEEHFDRNLKKSRRLLTYYDDIFSYTDSFSSIYANHELEWLSYHSSFCSISLVNEELVKKYVDRKYYEFSKNYVERAQSANIRTEYLSIPGLRNFAETGILDEIPRGICRPLEINDRILLLKMIYDGLGKKYFIINAKYLPVTDGWNAYVIDDKFVLLSNDSLIRYIIIDEINIVNAFSIFMRSINDTHLVLKTADAKKELSEIISELKNKEN